MPATIMPDEERRNNWTKVLGHTLVSFAINCPLSPFFGPPHSEKNTPESREALPDGRAGRLFSAACSLAKNDRGRSLSSNLFEIQPTPPIPTRPRTFSTCRAPIRLVKQFAGRGTPTEPLSEQSSRELASANPHARKADEALSISRARSTFSLCVRVDQRHLSLAPTSPLRSPPSAPAQASVSPLEQDRHRGSPSIAPCMPLSAFLH
jgi:hypothetical protein